MDQLVLLDQQVDLLVQQEVLVLQVQQVHKVSKVFVEQLVQQVLLEPHRLWLVQLVRQVHQ
jgi:hypothetical protein